MYTTYLEVGIARGLKYKRLKLYIAYMKKRWDKQEKQNVDTGYAEEWADRFLSGNEYTCSDLGGQALLDQLNKEII